MFHDNGQLPSGLRAGDVIDGKYRIDAVLGSGAMGVVVSAFHLFLGERVALKFLRPEGLGHPEAIDRFVHEGRAAVRIKSEHVARVLDSAVTDDGNPYIVMEYLEGQDLAHWLEQRGALAVDQAVEFLLQACEAIVEAHELGIVHRDLKPANLFVVRRADGVLAIKVLDFGISKTIPRLPPNPANPTGPVITQTIGVMGTPAYMSPEQMESTRDVDAQTDVWALGVILCELVTGRVPFDGHSMPEVYSQIVSRPPAIREWCPGIPPAIEDVILKCLKPQRVHRYRHVGDLALALASFAPKRAWASIDRIARTLEASKAIAENGEVGADGVLHARPAAVAEKTLCSWGEPAAAIVPVSSRRPVAVLRTLSLACGLAVAALAASLVFARDRHGHVARPSTERTALASPAPGAAAASAASPASPPLEKSAPGDTESVLAPTASASSSAAALPALTPSAQASSASASSAALEVTTTRGHRSAVPASHVVATALAASSVGAAPAPVSEQEAPSLGMAHASTDAGADCGPARWIRHELTGDPTIDQLHLEDPK